MTCACMDPTARHDLFATTVVGIDPTNGRHADVTLERCLRCAAVWLRYLVEFVRPSSKIA